MPMRIGQEERRARGPGERGARTPAADPGPAVAMAAAHALSLQTAAGNRAASAVLARQPTLTVLEDEEEKFIPEHIVHTLRRAIYSEETKSTAPSPSPTLIAIAPPADGPVRRV